MEASTKTHRPASWTWEEHAKDGTIETVGENERGATFVRKTLADIGKDTYDTLQGYFFACPPEIPIDEYKATLKFLKFLATLDDENVWETSGEEQIDASIYAKE